MSIGEHGGMFNGVLRNSENCLERFEALLSMDGMPAVLIVIKPLKAGDPVEVQVFSNYEIPYTQGVSYNQKTSKR